MFVPRYLLGDLDLTEAPFLVLQGEDRGAPQNVAQVVDSMLQDGEIVAVNRRSNRTMAYTVYIEETDLQACAAAEERLLLECDKPVNTFAIDPGDGFGAVTVFDTFTVQATFVYDARAEEACLRRYDLTWQALPFARASTLTHVAALTVGAGSDTQVNACNATTGWAVSGGGTLSLDTTRKFEGTGSLKVDPASGEYDAYDGDSYFRATLRADVTLSGLSVNLSTTPYLSLKVDAMFAESMTVEAFVDGVAVPLAGVAGLADGWQLHTFRSTDSSVSSVRFKITRVQILYLPSIGYPTPDTSIRFDDLRRGPVVLGVGSTTGRESLRIVEIDGSARTPASLQISHETNGLGFVAAYSNAALANSGYTPDLRRWKVSGSVDSTDVATISGKWATVGTVTPEVFRLPLDPLPRGGFLLLARGYSATFADVTVTASTRLTTGTLIGTRSTRNRNVQTVNGFGILADLTLPIADVPPGSGAQLELSILSMGSSVNWDEMLLYAMGDDAALTLVDCGTTGAATLGSANSRLWIDSATIERPAPTIWLGTAEGKTDAYNGDQAARRMSHRFPPGSVLWFVVNTGGASPAVSADYFERAHTNIVARS